VLVAGGAWTIYAHRHPDADPLSSSATYQRAMRHGQLIIGVKADQPGLSLRTSATGREEYHGFDVDMARHIARDLGFGKRIRFVTVDTLSRESLLINGQVDLVVASYSITAERERKVDFAGPYFLSNQDFLVRADERNVNGAEGLNGRQVCSAWQSTTAIRLERQYPQINLIRHNSYGECVEDLLDGTADAVSTDSIILAGYAKAHPGRLRLLGKPFGQEAWGIGMARGQDTLRQAVCTSIKRYVDSGGWDRSYQRYLAPLGLLKPRPATCDDRDTATTS
jgi:ABC-type amino acid transport substrate-binding protein